MKISKIKIGILFIFVVIVLIEGISLAGSQVNAAEIREEKNLNIDEELTLELINEYRVKNSLKKLISVSSLQKMSKLKADDLSKNKYFSHYSKNLGTPFEMLEKNKIDYKIAGENLARSGNPEEVVQAWINSTTHRQNILEEEYEYTGISVIEDETYGKIYVQIFAKF